MAELLATDGWKAAAHENGSVSLYFWRAGRVSRRHSWCLPQPSGAVKQRELWLATAVAHYLNAGGDLSQAREAFDWMGEAPPSPAMELLHTGPLDGDPGRFEHVFYDDERGKVVVWVEDLEVREMSWGEFHDLLRLAEETNHDQIVGIDDTAAEIGLAEHHARVAAAGETVRGPGAAGPD